MYNSSIYLNGNKFNYSTLEDQDVKSLYVSIEKKLSLLPIILMIAGTIGNMIAFYVLTRKKLRSQSTMIYFASLTVMDTISLYQWNFNFFYKYRLNSDNQNIEDQSLFLCRYISFMAYFSMQTSAWILTIISIDRYLIITNSNWKQKYSRNIKFSLIVILSIVFIIALINLPVGFYNGKLSLLRSNLINYDYMKLKSNRNVECYTTRFIYFWQKIAFFLECIFPLFLMIIFNGLLIKRTYKSSTKISHNTSYFKTRSDIKKSVSLNSNLTKKANKSVHNSNCDLSNSNECRKCEISSSAYLSEMKKENSNNIKHLNTLSPFINSNNRFRLKSKSEEFSIENLESKTSNDGCIQLSNYNKFLKVNDDEIRNYSLTNLVFLKKSLNTTNEPTNSSYLYASNCHSVNQLNSFNQIANNDSSMKRNSSGDTSRSLIFLSDSYRSSRKYFLNYRNRRIVLMLSLLTLSFTISTLPSSVFYTFFRPILNNKPYKRLLTMCFNLLRHLSHAFNFVIYFTSSSIIKQQLREIFNKKNLKKYSIDCLLKCFRYLNFTFICYYCCLNRSSKKVDATTELSNAVDGNEKKRCFKEKLSDNNKIGKENDLNLKNKDNDSGEYKMKIYSSKQDSYTLNEPSLSYSFTKEYEDNEKSNIDDIEGDLDLYQFQNDNLKQKEQKKINNKQKQKANLNLNVPKLMINSKFVLNKNLECVSNWY